MGPRLAWHPAQLRKEGTYIDLGGLLHPSLHLLSQGLPKIRACFILKHQRVNEHIHWSAPLSSASFYLMSEGPAWTSHLLLPTPFRGSCRICCITGALHLEGGYCHKLSISQLDQFTSCTLTTLSHVSDGL